MKRYEMNWHMESTLNGPACNVSMLEAADGDWVHYEEAKRLRAENERFPDEQGLFWRALSDALPTDGAWVLHTYEDVRAPEYGLFRNGRFWRGAGPESFPATHWLPVPEIVSPNSPISGTP